MKKILLTASLILIIGTTLFAYSQFAKKGTLSAVLLHKVELTNPPEFIFAITTSNQTLPDGKAIPKGTRFIGKFSREESGTKIYFNELQTTDGKKLQILGKVLLNTPIDKKVGGVSAKVGRSLQQQTKSNVLGAIFNNPAINQFTGSVLPRGSTLNIEID